MIRITTDTPVYVKEDGWYCMVQGREYGPYPDEADAWFVFDSVQKGGSCPTCEE